MAKCFCLFCINPTQAVEKAGVGEQRLSHSDTFQIFPTSQKWTRKAVIFVFHCFEVPCEKLNATQYKSLLHTIILPERLQLFLHRKHFLPPPCRTRCLVAICLLPNGAPCCLWGIRQGNTFPCSDTPHPTCQAAAGNWAGKASQCCPEHALYRLGR